MASRHRQRSKSDIPITSAIWCITFRSGWTKSAQKYFIGLCSL